MNIKKFEIEINRILHKLAKLFNDGIIDKSELDDLIGVVREIISSVDNV